MSASGGYHGALPVQVQGLLKPQGEQRAEPPVRGHRGAQPAESLGSSLVALYWRARPLRGFAPRAGIAARNPESSPPFRSSESSPSLRCAWVSASPDPGGHRAAQARAPHRHRGPCPFGRNEPARPGSPCIRAKAPSRKFVWKGGPRLPAFRALESLGLGPRPGSPGSTARRVGQTGPRHRRRQAPAGPRRRHAPTRTDGLAA